jgi:glycerophosphoryl diester phosphodiesterase
MLLLGHRGSRCSPLVPENSFAAFDLALQHGCDGFEFDIRLTRDGVAVVCHDPAFNRLAISRSNASSLADLPTLEAVLKRYGRRGFLDIESKVSGAETQLRRLLSRHPPKRGFVVSSFLPRVLLEMHRLDAKVPLALICGNPRQLQRWQDLPIKAVIAYQSIVTCRLLKDVHQAGKSLYVWTVNRKSAMVRLADMGVDGIISDRTDVLAHTFAFRASNP